MNENKIEDLQRELAIAEWHISSLKSEVNSLKPEAYVFRGIYQAFYNLIIDFIIMGFVSGILLRLLAWVAPALLYRWDMLIALPFLYLVIQYGEDLFNEEINMGISSEPLLVKKVYWPIRIVGLLFCWWLLWFHPYTMVLFYHDIIGARP